MSRLRKINLKPNGSAALTARKCYANFRKANGAVESSPREIVITGFNTDIEFGGVTYHVQTEDKGLERPLILSLVYAGGEILAAKRSPYEDLITAGFDEKVLIDRLNRQHKLICAAITQGRIEDLRRMSMRGETAAPTATSPVIEKTSQPVKQIEPIEIFAEPPATVLVEHILDEPLLEIPIEILDEVADLPEVQLDLNSVDAPRQPNFISPRQTHQTTQSSAQNELAETNNLSLKLLEEREFHGGERVALQIVLTRGATKPIEDAEIMIKILGSAFRPQIFQTQTDEQGLAVVHLQLPHFRAGRAALLIRAVADSEEIELRRIVSQG